MCDAILETSCTVHLPTPHLAPSSKDNSAHSKLHRDWLINTLPPTALPLLKSCLVFGNQAFIACVTVDVDQKPMENLTLHSIYTGTATDSPHTFVDIRASQGH